MSHRCYCIYNSYLCEPCACSKASEAFVCDSGALAVSHERAEQPLDLIAEACTNLGVPLGTQIHLALNCAAHELLDPVSSPKIVKHFMENNVLTCSCELFQSKYTISISV